MTLFRKTLLTVIAVIVAGAALTVLPRPAEACYCAWWGRADSILGTVDFDDISVAFAGRQIDSGSDRRVFQVERVYKGRAGPVLEFHTPDSAACGITGQGIEGAVATTWQGKLSVSFCSQVTVEQLEAAFGPGYPPDETMVATGISATAIFLLVGGGAVVLVGGTVLGLHLRKNSGNRLLLRPGDVDLLDKFRPPDGEERG